MSRGENAIIRPRGAREAAMETIRDLLQEKGHRPLCVTLPGSSVLEATRLMNAERIGAVLVVHDRRLAGIFTERDVLRRVVADGRVPDLTPVAEVMTADVLCWSTMWSPNMLLRATSAAAA